MVVGLMFIECNADLGHPCDVNDGEPCAVCVKSLAESEAQARMEWGRASPQERSPDRYAADMRAAGRESLLEEEADRRWKFQDDGREDDDADVE
jgi:hypothetical protein